MNQNRFDREDLDNIDDPSLSNVLERNIRTILRLRLKADRGRGVRPLLDTFRAQWKHRIDSVCSRIDPNGLRLRLTLSNSPLLVASLR
jgi:hypothetical protein